MGVLIMKNINNLSQNDLKMLLIENPDEVAGQLYKLAGAYLQKKKKYPDEDLIQELVMVGLRAIEKFDSKRSNFATYLYWCFKGYISDKRKKNMSIKNGGGQIEISIYTKTTRNVLLIDTLESEEKSPLNKIIEEEKQKFINEVMDLLDPLTIEWLNGGRQREISKKAGFSQANLSRFIKNDIEGARKKVLKKWRQVE